MSYFRTKKRKQNFLQQLYQNKHLVNHFHFFCFISTYFADFALKIHMQITFGRSFYILNNATWSVLQQTFLLVQNFIFFLAKMSPLLSLFSQ